MREEERSKTDHRHLCPVRGLAHETEGQNTVILTNREKASLNSDTCSSVSESAYSAHCNQHNIHEHKSPTHGSVEISETVLTMFLVVNQKAVRYCRADSQKTL